MFHYVSFMPWYIVWKEYHFSFARIAMSFYHCYFKPVDKPPIVGGATSIPWQHTCTERDEPGGKHVYWNLVK